MMINAMTIDFDSKDFENPEIQNLYSHIQALALNEDEVEEVEDLLQPDDEGMKSLEPLIEEFKKVVYGEGGYEDPDKNSAYVRDTLKKRVSPVGLQLNPFAVALFHFVL